MYQEIIGIMVRLWDTLLSQPNLYSYPNIIHKKIIAWVSYIYLQIFLILYFYEWVWNNFYLFTFIFFIAVEVSGLFPARSDWKICNDQASSFPDPSGKDPSSFPHPFQIWRPSNPLSHLCRPVRSTFAVRETASLDIMHYRLWGV